MNNLKVKEIYTVKSRLLEAISEARNREKPEDPDLNFRGENFGFKSLERELGIYHNTLYRALNGTGNLTIHTLIKISDYTGVSIDYLLGLSDNKYLIRGDKKC